MIERWGAFVARRALAVLLAGVAVAIAAGAYGFGVFDHLSQGGFDDKNSESARELQAERDTFGNQNIDVVAIYTSKDLEASAPEFRADVEEIVSGLARGTTTSVIPYYDAPADAGLVSKDGHSVQVLISLAGESQDDYLANYDDLSPTLEAPESTGLQTDLAGAFAVYNDVNEITSEDLARAESISLPVVVLLALLIFGSLVAASMPALVGLLAMVGALALVRVIAQFTEVSVFSVNVISLLGIGLAIDYALFVISRYREELALLPLDDPEAVPTAIRRTLATAGRTVLFSGLTVAAALSSLLIFPQAFLKSMGYGGVAAVLVAMLAALTVLPATLRLLGRGFESGRLPSAASPTGRGQRRARPLGGAGPRRDAPPVAGHRGHGGGAAADRVTVPRREVGQRRLLPRAALRRALARRGREARRLRSRDLDGLPAGARCVETTSRRTPTASRTSTASPVCRPSPPRAMPPCSGPRPERQTQASQDLIKEIRAIRKATWARPSSAGSAPTPSTWSHRSAPTCPGWG